MSEGVAVTRPGARRCKSKSKHSLEIIGATMAYASGARWADAVLMDCGCVLLGVVSVSGVEELCRRYDAGEMSTT